MVVEWLNVSSGLGRRAGLDLPGRRDRPPRPRLGRGLRAVHRGRGRRRGRRCRRRGADRDQGPRSGTPMLSPPGRRLLLLDLRLGRGRPGRRAAGRPGRRRPAGGRGVAVGVRAHHLRQRACTRRLPVFDGFLIHSRGGAAMPLGEPGAPRRPAALPRRRADADPRRPRRAGAHGRDRDRPARAAQLPARPAARLGVTSGSGRSPAPPTPTVTQIGEFEELLGCPRPVNRGQQAYVVRAALRWLDGWARGGDAGADRVAAGGRRAATFVARRGRQRPRRRPHAGRRRAGRAAARRHRAGRVVPLPAVRLAPCRWTRP